MGPTWNLSAPDGPHIGPMNLAIRDNKKDAVVRERDRSIPKSWHSTSPPSPAAPEPRLNIKTVLSTYGDFHVKDKTAVRTSYL